MWLDLDAIFDPDRHGPATAAAPDRDQRLQIAPDDLPPDWHLEWDERAATMEYDGCLPRERAEALALSDILARMRGEPRPEWPEGAP